MERKGGKAAVRFFFIAYCGLMLWLLFGRTRYYNPALPYKSQLVMNLVPFQTVRRYIRVLKESTSQYYLRHAVINLFGNVGMFLPLGFLLPAVFHRLRALWRTLLCTILIIAAVEVTQMLTLVGSCDIDDLILNTFGSGLGYFGYWLIRKRKNADK